jgi:hypothetical protein
VPGELESEPSRWGQSEPCPAPAPVVSRAQSAPEVVLRVDELLLGVDVEPELLEVLPDSARRIDPLSPLLELSEDFIHEHPESPIPVAATKAIHCRCFMSSPSILNASLRLCRGLARALALDADLRLLKT